METTEEINMLKIFYLANRYVFSCLATNEILLLLLCAKATFLYGLSSVKEEIDFILENYFTVVSHWCQTGRKKSLWCHIGVRQDKIFHCGVTMW